MCYRRLVLIKFCLMLFVSCNDIKKKYHSNGNIKIEYTTNDKGQYNGIFKEYFKDGLLKEQHLYENGHKVDSSVYYTTNERVHMIKYWNDSTNLVLYLDDNMDTLKYGNTKNGKLNFRIGKWVFKNSHMTNDSIVEYIDYKNQSYANQVWVIDKNQDTLQDKGNYYDFYMKDSTNVNTPHRLHFFLYQPYFNYDSDVEVVLPKNDSDLNSNFDNLFQIERDTFLSLKNDGISRPELSEEDETNHHIQFGLKFDTPGKKRVRGALIEYIGLKDNDLYSRQERIIFFEKYLYVGHASKEKP